MENVSDEIEKTRLKLSGNMKLTQKVKILTRFCLLLQSYLISQPLSIFCGFPDRLFYFFTIFFAIFYHSSQYLSLSIVIALPSHQNFGSYFLVSGKCAVTPHHLYHDPLTLTL